MSNIRTIYNKYQPNNCNLWTLCFFLFWNSGWGWANAKTFGWSECHCTQAAWRKQHSHDMDSDQSWPPIKTNLFVESWDTTNIYTSSNKQLSTVKGMAWWYDKYTIQNMASVLQSSSTSPRLAAHLLPASLGMSGLGIEQRCMEITGYVVYQFKIKTNDGETRWGSAVAIWSLDSKIVWLVFEKWLAYRSNQTPVNWRNSSISWPIAVRTFKQHEVVPMCWQSAILGSLASTLEPSEHVW